MEYLSLIAFVFFITSGQMVSGVSLQNQTKPLVCPEGFSESGDYCFYFGYYRNVPFLRRSKAEEYCTNLTSTLAYPVYELAEWQEAVYRFHISKGWRSSWVGAVYVDNDTAHPWRWVNDHPVQQAAWWTHGYGVDDHPGQNDKGYPLEAFINSESGLSESGCNVDEECYQKAYMYGFTVFPYKAFGVNTAQSLCQVALDQDRPIESAADGLTSGHIALIVVGILAGIGILV